jgi:hypothetical protein
MLHPGLHSAAHARSLSRQCCHRQAAQKLAWDARVPARIRGRSLQKNPHCRLTTKNTARGDAPQCARAQRSRYTEKPTCVHLVKEWAVRSNTAFSVASSLAACLSGAAEGRFEGCLLRYAVPSRGGARLFLVGRPKSGRMHSACFEKVRASATVP